MKKIETYALYGGALLFACTLIYVSIGSGEKVESNNSKEGIQIRTSQKIEPQEIKPMEKVQVFLFHSTNRCYSCVTAGKYTKEILEQNFSRELESGKIEFREINVDLPENKELANKFKASGTAFFINQITEGRDNIKEDAQIWRLVSNKDSFANYLSNRLNGILNSDANMQEK